MSSTSSQRRRRALRAAAPAAGLLAAGLLVWQGSYAAFSATTVNDGNAWTTGTLTLTNNGSGAYEIASTSAAFGEANLVPGTVGKKCITVKNGGSVPGSLQMYGTGVVTGSQALGDQLMIKVDAVKLAAVAAEVAVSCTGFDTTTATTAVIPSTKLTALPAAWDAAATGAISVDPSDRVVYVVNYTFATTGGLASDNALKGTTASSGFQWEIQTP